MPRTAAEPDDVRTLDLTFATAWPAAEVVDDEAWLLRASAGVTRRGNSALALGPVGNPDDRLARVERWYRERDIVPRVQVVPSSPAGLTDLLAHRGWEVGDGACRLMEISLSSDAVAAGRVAEWDVTGAATLTDAWTEVWWEVSPRGGDAELRHARAILERVPAPRRFALARGANGTPAGCALGVVVGELLVLEAVATRAIARRQGVCRALTGALAAWAAGCGARRAVLTVEQANTGGIEAWERLGFTTRGEWTYAVAPPRR